MEEVLKTPSGVNLPPSPGGKAMARRLWAEAEAKTAAKAERDHLPEEELREHEKILREDPRIQHEYILREQQERKTHKSRF